MQKRKFQITIELTEGMYLYQEGGSLSDDDGKAISFGSVQPSGSPYIAIYRGPNKGYYGCNLTHFKDSLIKLVSGEIAATEEE